MICVICLLLAILPAAGEAAEAAQGRVRLRVLHETAPVRGASIEAGSMRGVTAVNGEAQLTLDAGDYTIRIERAGFATVSVPVAVRADGDQDIIVQLRDASLESQVIVVTATRSGLVASDQPIRVEAVPEEEIEENLTIQPGNLSTLLNEIPGVRMESTAPGLGGATLQIRGLPGRLTQVLSDGLPLIGGEPGGFGLLQTPPLDLARVEVVKGVASALYGGSALGGVLNLVSRRPGGDPELLLARSSRGGTDAAGFATGVLNPVLGYSVTAGAHFQERHDIDGDAWADLPRYERYTFRPRIFYDDDSGRSLLVTAGLVDEERAGGSMPGRTLGDGTVFVDALHTQRMDGGMAGRWPLKDGRFLGIRVSATSSDHERAYGPYSIGDNLTTLFAESTLSGRARGHSWVVGAAFEQDRLQVSSAPGVGYTYAIPSVFAQDEFAPTERIILAASGRVDAHSDYGTFVSPRLSAVFLPTERWTLRASFGTGYAAPTPFVEDVESAGLGALDPLTGLRAERAASASLDAQWNAGGWEVDVSAFGSEIRHPLGVRAGSDAGRIAIVNGDGPRRALGAEALLRYVAGPLHLIGSYTYLDATDEAAGGGRRAADRVPRHAAELAAMLEDETRGRIGVEIAWTGRQSLNDNPYRSISPSFAEVNALAEIRFGETAVFLNAMNLTGERQTDHDPLLRTARGIAGQPVTELWAPLAGRVFNLGIRMEF